MYALPLQIGLDLARSMQPFRSAAVFQEVADALNGAPEAHNCSVKVSLPASSTATASRVLSYPLPTSGHVVFADPNMGVGSDLTGTGTMASPFRSIERAMEEVRAVRAHAGIDVATATDAPTSTIVLRAGVFHLTATLQVTPDDSQLTFQAYPGEEVGISGASTLPSSVTWAPYTPAARPAYEYRAGGLAAGFDVIASGTYTIPAAEAMCNLVHACAGFTYNSGLPTPPGTVTVSFKSAVFFVPGVADTSSYVKNAGYGPGQTPNVWVADVASMSLPAVVEGLRVNGVRGIRARYPNAGTVEQMGAMQLVAERWIPQARGTNAASTYNPDFPYRDWFAENYFEYFLLGIGGPCADRFTPQAGYWCGAGSQGGGPGPYQAPTGMVASDTVLPHTPYGSSPVGAAVHTWRAGRW